MKNPFELNFGIEPSNYISRINQSQEVISSFEKDGPNNVYLITGMRGSGKTVLLSNIAHYFSQKDHWITVELVPSYDMLDQLASALYDASLLHRIFSGKTFGFSFQGISFSIQGERPLTNVISLLDVLLEKIGKSGKKVLISVDEVSNNQFVKPFVQTFQVLLRKQHPLYLLMTGLFQNVCNLQNDKALTFLYRAPKIFLEPLNIGAIAHAYSSLLSLPPNEALSLAKITKGYAFAYQVLGYILFEKEERKIDDGVLVLLDQYLQEYAYLKTWSECSPVDKKLLSAFQSEEAENVDDLAIRANMDKKTFSVYRDRLIKRGLLVSEGYGKLSLALPRFVSFLNTVR